MLLNSAIEFVNLFIKTFTLCHHRKCSLSHVNGLCTWLCISALANIMNLEIQRRRDPACCINLLFVLLRRRKLSNQVLLDRQRQAGAGHVFVISVLHTKALTVARTNGSDKFKCHILGCFLLLQPRMGKQETAAD